MSRRVCDGPAVPELQASWELETDGRPGSEAQKQKPVIPSLEPDIKSSRGPETCISEPSSEEWEQRKETRNQRKPSSVNFKSWNLVSHVKGLRGPHLPAWLTSNPLLSLGMAPLLVSALLGWYPTALAPLTFWGPHCNPSSTFIASHSGLAGPRSNTPGLSDYP